MTVALTRRGCRTSILTFQTSWPCRRHCPHLRDRISYDARDLEQPRCQTRSMPGESNVHIRSISMLQVDFARIVTTILRRFTERCRNTGFSSTSVAVFSPGSEEL